jgi:alpha-beta hydrolase superfamily lysophospholipase
MESGTQNIQPSTKVAETQQASTSINTETGAIVSTKSEDRQEIQEWVDLVKNFLADFPNKISLFFTDYRQPLVTLGLIAAGFISVKFTLALLDAINSIVLLAPLLELVGLGYTGWFAVRYLLKASTRQELSQEIEAIKKDILGKNSENS